MKQKFVLLLATLFVVAYAKADPALPEPFNVTQPDGTVLTLHTVGDEYYHWTETSDNQVVVLSEEGYYEYATILGNDIVPSGVKVQNLTDYSQVKAQANIANKEQLLDLMMSKREAVLAYMNALIQVEESETINPLGSTAQTASTTSLTKGNQKVLCILIGFPDKPFTKSKADFENMWNQTNYNVEGSFGSIKDFYYENSYGQMNVTATIVGPYVAKKNSSYYGTEATGIVNSNVRELVEEALEAAKNDIQFSDFDVDGDRYVDAVHVVFAGYAYYPNQPSGLIWPHHWILSTAVKQGLYYKAKQYFITSELASGSGNKIAPIGTVCHEYGHQLGAPDYYSKADYPGTGAWDVMGGASWNGPNGNRGRCPAHHNPYTKAYIYNWVQPTLITSSASNVTYSLAPSHNNAASIYRINTSTNNEFFLLENKRAVANTFNSCVPNPGGLLIYHIHSDIEDAIANQNVNNSHPQKCYIVCANATSNPTSSASSYGTTGIECAYPYSGNVFFTSNSTPSATSWAGNATGINLCFIQRVGNYIKFIVNPKINGSAVLSTRAAYSVADVPADAKIKWTYTFRPNSAYPNSPLGRPIVFLDGDSTASVVIERGKFIVRSDSVITEPITPRDSVILMNGDASLNSFSYAYYTGTAVLTATITSGGYSYVITKSITLASSGTAALSDEILDDTADVLITSDEDANICNHTAFMPYRLTYENPISSNNSIIHIEKLSESTDGYYTPYSGNYTLEIWSDRLGLVKRISDDTPIVHLDCVNFPIGVYHILLIVNGQVVVQNKILKL